jgi:hypothetical protein
MRVALLLASIATLLNAPAVRSQNTNDIQFVIDAIFSLCVGGGGTVSVSASGNADDSFSLRKSDTAGRVREVTINKSEAKGLVAGLNNAISSVAADQADKVRECIKPYRDRIMNMVLTTSGVVPATSKALPAELDISGVWRDEWGFTSWITQQGNAFKYTARGDGCRGKFQASGSGTIRGNIVEHDYQIDYAQGRCSGTVSSDGRRITQTCADPVCGQFRSSAVRQ